MEDEAARGGETFDPDLIRAIFKLVWSRRGERGGGGGDAGDEVIEVEPAPETSRRNRSATEAFERDAFCHYYYEFAADR
uniref:Uncharacterized protein n=2 Tax=Oryza TaxID=4527 RepID=A0A0E0PAM4_ORYRU